MSYRKPRLTSVAALFPKSFVEHLFLLVESTRDGDEILNYTLIKLIVSHERAVGAGLTSCRSH
jgi:hypothetical protein